MNDIGMEELNNYITCPNCFSIQKRDLNFS